MPIDAQTAALIITLVGMTAGGIWKLSRVEAALRKDINDAKQEVEARQDVKSRETGETIAAIRQHVTNFQLEVADKYVRRDGFYKVRDELAADINRLGDKLEARLARMEEKLDSKT